jgi:hypothetical protein
VSFLGAQISESGFIPPDSMGAVGPSQILVCVNGRIKVFDKTGVLGALNTTTLNFFSSQSVSSPSDPRVRFDRLSGRWFVVMIDVPHSKKNNKVLVAVSSGSTITDSTGFTFFSFVHSSVSGGGDVGWFADYPTLGIDRNALYVGVNIFNANAYEGTSAYVINKSGLLTGTLTVTAFRQLAGSSGPGPSTPQGVDNDDPAASDGFLIGVANDSQGLLVLRRISNPGDVPSISGDLNLVVPPTAAPVGVPVQGSTVPLDALDDRLFVARMHKGSLWTAHNILLNSTGTADPNGNRVGSRWYEITNLTAIPGLRQSGTLFDAAPINPANYWIPSCMVNGQGHMVLGCSVAGASEFAEIAVAGRWANDPLGVLQQPAVVQASSTAYNVSDGVNPHRWGDYSLTTVDPNDDMTFWTVQEYCNANNSWGVQVIQIKAPPPATPLVCNPSTVTAGAMNVDVLVTGVAISGSSFFDPGPGYSNHLAVAINGTGVAINSVTVNDPMHLTVNLSISSGASAGARALTVTNPDGQIATSGSGILTIVGSGTNHPPTLSHFENQEINEDTALPGLAFSVGDPETPAGSLSLSASSSNTNLIPISNIIFGGSDSNRTVTVLPGLDQNGTALITITVTDSQGASASESFILKVNPVNDPPSFLAGPNQSLLEDAGPQVVSNWATAISAGPADEAGQGLSFFVSNDNSTLFSEQPSVTSDGTLTYTPAPNANGTALVTLQLHDDGGTANGGGDTSPAKSFAITVTPVNDPPVLEPIQDQIIDEGSTLVITNIATDPDIPSDPLTFRLIDPPAGAGIDSQTGVFTWTPAEEQGPGTNLITVVVDDHGSPSLSATQTFTVRIREVNLAPILAPIADQMLHQGCTLTLSNTVTDADLPANSFTYSLSNAPPSAAINPVSGILTWTPTADEINTTNLITVLVTDDGSPPLSDAKTFTAIALSPPAISSVTRSGNAVTLTWDTISGFTYRVQSTSELTAGSVWEDLTGDVTASNLSANKVDRGASGAQRFYRVIVVACP